MEIMLPKRREPNTETELLSRAVARRDKDDPVCRKSSEDNELPNAIREKIEATLPTLWNPRKLTAEP